MLARWALFHPGVAGGAISTTMVRCCLHPATATTTSARPGRAIHSRHSMSELDTAPNTRTDEQAGARAEAIQRPHLIVAFEWRRPLVPGLRVSLDDVDEIVIARGTERAVTRKGRVARLTLPDSRLSSEHVRLRRSQDEWDLADLSSMNGTHLNGTRTTTAELADGDVIEIGHNTLMFREIVPNLGAADLGDHDLAADASTPLGLRTLIPGLEHHWSQLAPMARSSAPILVRGATGTGKELVAGAIHQMSGRQGAFVAVNCGALPSGLMESELFGHRRGAFTGAGDDRLGLIRRAHRGTLLLDEIAELPMASQAVLLRVLQQGEVLPVGGNDAVRVDVQVIAATHQNLDRMTKEGRFREDLHARLKGFEVHVPALRDRREDLGTLVAGILPRICEPKQRITIRRDAARAMLAYGYPQNVRELEHTLRRATVLANDGEIRLDLLPEDMRVPPPPPKEESTNDRALRCVLIDTLRATRGNVKATARAFGKEPVQIRRWCRRFGIQPSTFRQ